MDCRPAHEDNSSKVAIDIRNYKHYEWILAEALRRNDPVVLEWITDGFEVVKE